MLPRLLLLLNQLPDTYSPLTGGFSTVVLYLYLMSTSTGVIFAKVKSSHKVQRNGVRGWNYYLSNDAVMFLPNPNLKIGSWNYFEVRMDAFKTMHYVSHCPVGDLDGKLIEKHYQELKFQANQVNKFWRQLSDQERHCMMTMLGIGLSGAGAATMGLGAATAIGTAIAEECLLSAVTGGLSLVVSGGLATISYLQWEELKKKLAAKKVTVEALRIARERYADLLHDHCPFQYKSKVAYDPQVTSLVHRLKLIFDDFEVNDLWQMDDSNLTWYGAPA